MILLTFLAGVFATAIATLVAPAPFSPAGTVSIPEKDFTIYDYAYGNIKAIAAKGNRRYIHPDSYEIYDGYACQFWADAPRGMGIRIGEFHGPTKGKFKDFFPGDWPAYYMCWASPPFKDCGFVRAIDTNWHQLIDNGEYPEWTYRNFTRSGKPYNPTVYDVREGCWCKFYRQRRFFYHVIYDLVATVKGREKGTFHPDRYISNYKCWSSECIVGCERE